MSTDKYPVVDRLRKVFTGTEGIETWKNLSPDQQEAIKDASIAIFQLDEQLNTPPQDPPRFPDSRYVIFTSERGQLLLPVKEDESAGVLWEVTVRGDDIHQMAAMVKQAQAVMIANGFIPKDTYQEQRRNERQQPQAVARAAVTPGQTAVASQVAKGEYLIVKCKELSPGPKSDKDSSPIWKVLTDKSKFPVPFWDLEDEGVNRLDDQRSYLAQNGVDISEMYTSTKPPKPVVINMTGWIAHCTQNDNGFPAKIVKLEKIG